MDKILIPFSEFEFSYARSSGAGGQNVNKVNTKVILYWNPDSTQAFNSGVVDRFKTKYASQILENGLIQIISQEHRSQKANQDACVEKLYKMIESVLRPPKTRKPTKPKRSAVLKRLSTKKKDGEKKQLRRKDY